MMFSTDLFSTLDFKTEQHFFVAQRRFEYCFSVFISDFFDTQPNQQWAENIQNLKFMLICFQHFFVCLLFGSGSFSKMDIFFHAFFALGLNLCKCKKKLRLSQSLFCKYCFFFGGGELSDLFNAGLCVCLFEYLSVCLCVCLFVCFSSFFVLFVYFFVSPFVSLYVSLSVSVSLPVCVSVWLSV